MLAPRPSLTLADLTTFVARDVFGGTPDPEGCDVCGRDGIGIELEFLTGGPGFRRLRLDEAQAVMDQLVPLPRGSRLTLEPGGQLELSTRCFVDLHSACEAAAIDLFTLDSACARRGIDLVA